MSHKKQYAKVNNRKKRQKIRMVNVSFLSNISGKNITRFQQTR